MGEGIIVMKLCEILVVIDHAIDSSQSSIRIGLEEVPIHSLSSCCCSKDIGLPILENEADEGKGSKPFFSVEMMGMEGECFE